MRVWATLRATFVLALALWTGAAAAADAGTAAASARIVHRVSATTQSLPLTDSALAIEDASGTLTAQQVATLAETGGMKQVSNQRIAMLRLDAGEAWWFKLDVAADASAPADWMLEVEKPVLDHVRLYARQQDGRWEAFPEVGAAHPFSARLVDHRHFVFPVRIQPGGATSFLLRVQYAGPATPKAILWQPAALQATATGVFGVYCLYFGLCAGMLLYNLLLHVAVKDRGYLFYSGCVACTALALGGHSGLGAQYLWGEHPWWTSHAMYMAFGGALFFSAQLTRHFLQLAVRMPATDRVLRVLAWMSAACVPLAGVLPSNLAAASQMPLGLTLGVMVSALSVLGAVRRWPGATYFWMAWVSLYVGVVAMFLRLFGAIPDNMLTFNSLAVSSAVEMVLLSLALADRINDETRQKEEAKSLTLGIVQASQEFGTESRLDRLHSKVCDIVARVTGASSVRLVLWDADLHDWFLIDEDQGGSGGHRIAADQAAQRGLVSLPTLRQVEQAREPVAAPDGALYLPILHHGTLSAVLLLTNQEQRERFAQNASLAIAGIAGPLAVSLESALLYERLEQRVAERTRELRDTQQELMATARRAGKAEIATNVLHNVGNTLNSVNVSAQLVRSRLDERRNDYLVRTVDLLLQHRSDLAEFLEHDPKGRIIPDYLRELAAAMKENNLDIRGNLDHLIASVDHIARVVATQQAHAGPSLLIEALEPEALVDEALRVAAAGREDPSVTIVKDVRSRAVARLDRTRTLQILINLIDNALRAMATVNGVPQTLTIRIESEGERLRFQVSDTGCGIDKLHLPRVFSHGFSTRDGGHGFGLHSCAIAATEMGGTLTAHSDGPDTGATFVLDLPMNPEQADG